MRRFAWGAHDCCTFFADWAVLRGNVDPMAYLRGCYNRSEFAAMRTIMRHDGLLAAVTRGMIDALIPEVDEPLMGDMAVIERSTQDGLGLACALYGGVRWVSLGLRGIESGPARPLTVWRP